MKTSTFLLAATITLSCTCCTQKATETESNTSENLSSKILVNGTEISYQLVGEGAYTLVFAHGWCINQSYWIDQVNAFKSNYQVLTLDLPGFGESGKNRPDWSIESYGNDLNEVINQLKLANVILIGHSMSGDIVLEAALNDPKIVAVIGVDTFKDVGTELTEEVQAEIEGFMGMLKENFAEVASAYAMQAMFHPSTDSLVIQQVIKDFSTSEPSIAVNSLENLFEYAAVESVKLSKLQQKLILINSDATPTHFPGLDASGVNYQVIDIPSTGHYPMVEKPGLFNEKLTEALAQIKK